MQCSTSHLQNVQVTPIIVVIHTICHLQFLHRYLNTNRWANLKKSMEGKKTWLSVKSLSDTNWTARAASTEVLVSGYSCIQNDLRDIASHLEQIPVAQSLGRKEMFI